MKINKLRRQLFLTQRTLGDIQAMRNGRGVQRFENRLMGRLVNRFMRRLWR